MMTKQQTNLVISWLILASSMAIIFVNDIVGMIVAIIAVYFRDLEYEKESWSIFQNKYNHLVKVSKYIVLIIAIPVLIHTIYAVATNPYISIDELPGMKAIILIFSPMCILGIFREYYLFKALQKNMWVNN